MISATLVFRFPAHMLDARLSFIVINILTLIAFFFIISHILPLIPYLTFIDKYMNTALLYVVGIGVTCVVFSEFSLENTKTEDYVFTACLSFILLAHIVISVFCVHIRRVEFFKTTLNRHQVDEMEGSRLLNSWCTQEKVGKDEEYIVHTDLHPLDTEFKVYEGSEVSKRLVESDANLGWLYDDIDDSSKSSRTLSDSFVKSSPKTKVLKSMARRMTSTITPFFYPTNKEDNKISNISLSSGVALPMEENDEKSPKPKREARPTIFKRNSVMLANLLGYPLSNQNSDRNDSGSIGANQDGNHNYRNSRKSFLFSKKIRRRSSLAIEHLS